MKDWKQVRLGDCVKTNTNNIEKDYPYADILYLDTGSITSNRINNLQEVCLSKAPSRAKRLVKNEDIIYSTVRPNQLHYGFIKNPPYNLVVSTGFCVISCKKDIIHPKFLLYYLSSNELTEHLHSIAEASTSTYPSLKPIDIEVLLITLPPLSEQRAIAEVLSSLDDKIDLLHRQNKTLEQMAETLFRQWFIEEAKEDWEEAKLGDVSCISIGRTPPRKENQWFSNDSSDTKWVSIKDMGNGDMYIMDTTECLTKEAISSFNIPIIPKGTVILSFKMTIGRVAITSEEMLSNEAIAHFNSIVAPITNEYLYFFLKNFKFETLGSTSSIVTSINTKMINNIPITIPDRTAISKFVKGTEYHFDKIKQNQTQIRTLEKMRDTLLPKLMSGEVRVADIDVYRTA